MGWSDSAVADDVMRAIIDKAVEDTGTQSVFKHKGKNYWIEVNTQREYADGSITGTLYEAIGFTTKDESWKQRKIGSFKIDGRTGKTRPAWLGEMVK
jgi:hypothetical protein